MDKAQLVAQVMGDQMISRSEERLEWGAVFVMLKCCQDILISSPGLAAIIDNNREWQLVLISRTQTIPSGLRSQCAKSH